MQNNIVFFQTTELINDSKSGLVDLFMIQLKDVIKNNLFTKIQVIVPNQAVAIWLKDKVALTFGICANIDCVVLPSTVIENIYKENHDSHELLDYKTLKYLIYDYLIITDLHAVPDLCRYLYNDADELNLTKAFQLAEQLQDIFYEYLYLRTKDLLNLSNSNIQSWQQDIWKHITSKTANKKNYLDIYQYFMNNSGFVNAPDHLFIFGLTSIYPSQLDILCKLSEHTSIYWYYQPCSREYYGDLLSNKARSNIEKKLLRQPYLNLDDLYLTDGNPLLANLGQQSREFIELLRANDIDVYDFSAINDETDNSTMLSVIQNDIRSLKNRVRLEHRLSNNIDYYVEPVTINFYKNCFDVSDVRQSIKINVCHNRMREVQVMFNEIMASLNNNDNLQVSDILVVAPDIDTYASYIAAVFDNECAINQNGDKVYIPYLVTGNRRYQQSYLLETLLQIMEAPYMLTVNSLLHLLELSVIKNSLDLDNDDIKLIKKWLVENHTHFGYDEHDYAKFGYANFSAYSFKQLLNNLTLGICISDNLFGDKLPVLEINNVSYAPYDNLDYKQATLASKLIGFINMLESLRDNFYLAGGDVGNVSLGVVIDQINLVRDFLALDEEQILVFDKFISELNGATDSVINILILQDIIRGQLGLIKSRLTLSGVVNCMSLQYARNLPYKYVYVLGMNFGEFPSSYKHKQLSILSKDWYLADRNYTIEDKQAFLDVILSVREQIVFSYIGCKETDNTEIKPSPILSLFMTVIGNSFKNFWVNDENLIKQEYNFAGLIERHSLHPFYNNLQDNYSVLWQKFLNSNGEYKILPRWEFARNIASPIKLTDEQKKSFLEINLASLEKVFLYTNNNLYRTLGINKFDNREEFDDLDTLTIEDRKLAKNLKKYFIENYSKNYDDAYAIQYLVTKGLIGFGQIGVEQFTLYKNRYSKFVEHTTGVYESFVFKHTIIGANKVVYEINISDTLLISENNIIIHEEFSKIDKSLGDKFIGLPYELMVRGVVLYCILALEENFLNKHKIENIIVRQIDKDGSKRDVIIRHSDALSVANNILYYYLRSLTYPILIHKKAIEEFVKASNEKDKRTGAFKNTPFMIYNKAKLVYENGFNNTGLDALRSDILYAPIAENYFEYMDKCSGINDIIKIGELFVGVEYACN